VVADLVKGDCSGDCYACGENACPDTSSYNGKKCIYRDPCCYGVSCGSNKCVEIEGRWDASQKRCVKCDGRLQGKVIADTTQRCEKINDYSDCRNEVLNWLTCADRDVETCESACGAPAACDDKAPNTPWCDGYYEKYCSSTCDVVNDGCESDCGATSYCDELGLWQTDSDSCCADTCTNGGPSGYIRYDGSYDRLCDDTDTGMVWRKANLNKGKIYWTGKYDALSNYWSWIECDGDGIEERTGDGQVDGITVSRFCHKGAPASICGGYTGSSLISTAHDYICGVDQVNYQPDAWFECCGDTTCTSANADGVKKYENDIIAGGGRAFICCGDELWHEYDPTKTGCCYDDACSNNYACNLNTHTCYTSCSLNSHCTGGYCCEAEIGIDINGGGTDDCVINGRYGNNNQYLCYHASPSRWIVCNEENLNKKVEVNNITYTCVNQNGNYSWITGYTTKQNKANLFELIINFFKNLFNFLKSE
jgi:hypothetical protein